MFAEVKAIQAVNLTKIYPHPFNSRIKTTILARVNFTFKLNAISYLTGPSGSGKTTLLHILTGLLAFNAGEVFIGSHSLQFLSRRQKLRYLRSISSVAQIPRMNLDLQLSLRDNLRLPLVLGQKIPFELQKKKGLILKKQSKRHLRQPNNLSLTMGGGLISGMMIMTRKIMIQEAETILIIPIRQIYECG